MTTLRISARTSRRILIGSAAGSVLAATVRRPTRAQCQAVELRPGYPGYAGYVTGLAGFGDAACLDTLLIENPGFDHAVEDAENLAAASRLGVDGTPDEWPWENWMAIEAERGTWPTCYSCAIFGATPRSGFPADWVIPDDPRLLIGGYATTTAVDRLSAEFGRLDSLFPYDRHLRAVAGLLQPGYLDPWAMLETYRGIAAAVTSTQYIDVHYLWGSLIEQGGYAPVPTSATMEDQEFMIWTALEAVANFMPDDSAATAGRMMEAATQSWRIGVLEGSDTPLRVFLQSSDVADLF